MLGGWGLPPLDLPALLQFGITALVLVCGLLFVLRNAASRYFVVDAGFEAEPGNYEGRSEMSVGDEKCFVCGRRGTKKCARCKGVRYCSQECQARHWKDGHRLKCKEPKLLDDSLVGRTGGRRKTSSIALVPARGFCKVLEQPKKILFPYDEFVKLFNWEKHVFPPCGLLNCGNSCFANVVLQCLACTRPLVAYLLEGRHLKTCSRNDWCFLCELQIHIQKVSQSMKPFSPINILSRLPKIGGNLGNGRQEDAHEFMRFAIDMMQSVCLDEFGGEKALDLSVQETTLIQHIFGGYLQSQVKCTKCDKISNRYENMMDLTVEIQGDAEALEECLNQFTGKEWLDGENMYRCDGCDEYVKAWKRLTVHQPPNILTIALKRFQSGRFGKLNKRITFPVTLNLGPYMSGSGDGTDLYTLYAVVVHIDMLNASFFGHYICYTKDFYGNWYRIDDCKVTKVNIEEVLAQGAYMLLYSRINVRQPFLKDQDSSKTKDEQSTEVVSLSNIVSTESMENGHVRASIQRQTDNLDLDMPAKSDIYPVVEKMDDVHLNVPQNMNLEKVQEVDSEECQKMELDESGESDSCKAVADDLNAVNPDHLSEQNPLSPKEFDTRTTNFHVGLNVPSNMDLDKLQEVDLEESQKMALDESRESVLCKAVVDDRNSVNPDQGLSEQNPLSQEFEVKTDNCRASEHCHITQENGPIRTSEEFFTVEKASITKLIPASHEMTETLESNPSGPRSDHMSPVDGLSDIENRGIDLHDSFPSSGHQGNLESFSTDSTNTEELDRFSSHCFSEKDLMVKVDMDIENGVGHFCGHRNCNQLECGYDNLNSRENLKPLFYPGFLDHHTQKKSQNGKPQMKRSELGLPGNNFAVTKERAQLNSTKDGVHYNTNHCNGLLFERENVTFEGRPKPTFHPALTSNHVQKTFPIGDTETENMEIGILNTIPTENGKVDSQWNSNSDYNGLLHESGRSSCVQQSKLPFSRGFLDHHAEKRHLKGKVPKPGGGALACKDNGNCSSASYPPLMQQNGDDSISHKPLSKNQECNLVDSSELPFVSRGFLNKSYEKSVKDVGTTRNNQNGLAKPTATGANAAVFSLN